MLSAQIEGAIAGGIDVVQIREPGLPARDLARFARQCMSAIGRSRVRLVINDRLDVALAVGAHGVHLREDSIAIADARRLVPPRFVVGRSVHEPPPAARARSADYLITGSVFASRSKPGRPASLGLGGLRAMVRAADPCPVWAIGGITAERVRDVADCGASGVAAIGAFLPRPGTTAVASEVKQLTETLRRASTAS